MEKTRIEITEASHPMFAEYLKDTTIHLISHEDGTFEWFCRKSNGDWLNGYDYMSETAALNAVYRKLAQGHTFVEFGAAISNALLIRGIKAPKGDLAKYLKKWKSKHSAC